MKSFVLAIALVFAGCGGSRLSASPDAGAVPCEGGSCSTACAGGLGTLCAGRCVDLASDHDNCGRCGNACDVRAACEEGACGASCPSPLTACGGQCADLSVDPHHCGSCSNDCGEDRLCHAGACTPYCSLAAPRMVGPGNTGDAVGDVDGNGTLDIVALSTVGDPPTMNVYLGGGDGTFRALAAQSLPPGPAGDVALADLNGDGRLDAALLTGSGNLSLTVYVNQGGGVFALAGSASAGVWSSDLALADVDGDGAPDAVIANSGGSQWTGGVSGNDVTVLFNDGKASFGRAVHLQTGSQPVGVAVADFNGDGVPDIAYTDIGDPAGSTVTVFTGDGHGAFSATQPIVVATNGAFGATDLDADGRPDLALVDWGYVRVLRNRGGGAFAAPAPYTAPFSGSLALGDVNGDGSVDIVVGGAGLAALYNRGDGTFAPAAGCMYPNEGGDFTAASPIVARFASGHAAGVVTIDDSQTNGEVAVWEQQ